eukprot:Pgem_evm1s3330
MVIFVERQCLTVPQMIPDLDFGGIETRVTGAIQKPKAVKWVCETNNVFNTERR